MKRFQGAPDQITFTRGKRYQVDWPIRIETELDSNRQCTLTGEVVIRFQPLQRGIPVTVFLVQPDVPEIGMMSEITAETGTYQPCNFSHDCSGACKTGGDLFFQSFSGVLIWLKIHIEEPYQQTADRKTGSFVFWDRIRMAAQRRLPPFHRQI
jgi:hypothetical protein